MKLLEPTVGPIVGHTTDNEARIWARGDVIIGTHGRQRCTGALRIRKPGGHWPLPQMQKLEAHFDGSGVFVLQKLDPDTLYEYQVGWYIGEGPLDIANLAVPPKFEWHNTVHAFRTQPSDAGRRSFLAGSCRYLLRLKQGAVFDERGDKIFESMLRDHARERVHGILFTGDQIYADDMNVLAADQFIDEYFARYQTVFSQPAFAKLLHTVPTYMTLDDHEIENDWPKGASKTARLTKYYAAMHAYQVYQASHSPLFETANGKIVGVPEHYWYSFANGPCDFFVMDARTERDLQASPPKMLSQRQLDSFYAWLLQDQGAGRVKMVVSAVPFLSTMAGEAEDKWSGFSEQRNQILDFIAGHNIENVVFISGDVHSSYVCTARFDEHVIHQIVSSALFWPVPAWLGGGIDVSSPITTQAGTWTLTPRSEMHRTENYARIDVDTAVKQIVVQFTGRKDQPLGTPTMLSIR